MFQFFHKDISTVEQQNVHESKDMENKIKEQLQVKNDGYEKKACNKSEDKANIYCLVQKW